jgi:HEAT repeat protein
MGLFDLFKAKPAADSSATPGPDKNVARLAKVAADKHAQNYDRIEAIEALARVHTSESAAALLRRFTFHIDPSITDQEEKESALRGILDAGDSAIEPIRAFCVKAESLSWPLKILKELVPAERYADELIALLERFDTEYARNTEPKNQLISELAQHPSPRARSVVERFLEDVNESIRFVAVATTFAQEDAASTATLVSTLVSEESVRVKIRIAEGLAKRGWPTPDDTRAELRAALPNGFSIDPDGKIVKR